MAKSSISPSSIIALAPRAALFGRLEDDDRRAGEVAGGGEIARRAEQDRGVAVVAAGMHAAGNGRAIGQVGRLLDRQRVHVGAQADRASACALAALDDADDAALADAGANLVAAEFAQPLGDEGRGLVDVVEKLGMGVEMAAPALGVGNELGDGGVYGHERRAPERESMKMAVAPRRCQRRGAARRAIPRRVRGESGALTAR